MTTQREKVETMSIEPRVARLEQFAESLDADVKSLSVTVDRMAKETQIALARQYDVIERQGTRLDDALNNLRTTMAASRQANWPVMLSAATVVLAIGALAFQPYRERTTAVEERTTKLELAVQKNAQFHSAQEVTNESMAMQVQSVKELAEMRDRHLRELLAARGVLPGDTLKMGQGP